MDNSLTAAQRDIQGDSGGPRGGFQDPDPNDVEGLRF
jgi:hypothetical protein